uniref:HECT domain-containing protein n=1 Tax=Heterorhabditis bacteriophora TaxID=37862 RepID=A0A1I7X6B7_HETBA
MNKKFRSAPTMSWTFRRAPSTRQLRSEEDWAAEHERREREREQERRERDDRNGNYSRTQRPPATTSSSQPPPPSTVTADAPRVNRRNSRHEEAIPGTLLASYQMSTAFMFLIRALGEVLLQLHFEEKIENIRILTRLEPSWGWMYTVLDRVEAQLRFGNAVMASGITDGRHRTGSQKRKESGAVKKEKGEDAGCSRRDALDYLLSVLRSQSAEAGDDLPIIEIEVLRTLAFVFDAHVFYADNLEFLKTVMKTREEENVGVIETQETNLEAPIIRRFFQRSSSVCFAGAMSSDAWDTMGMSSSHLPLVDRPHILTPDADRDSLFAPPARALTRVEYEQISRNLGVEHVGNQSLTTASEHPRLVTQEEEVEDLDFSPTDEPIHAPEGMEPLSIEAVRAEMKAAVRTPLNLAMARWKNALQLMARECHQDMLSALGGETGKSPLLSTIARFPVRQTHFKKTMDKFRTAQTKDISLEVHRDPAQLVRDTVFQLNQTYVRRVNAPRGRDLSVPDALQQPFGSGRVSSYSKFSLNYVRLIFKGLQTLKKLPFDELGWGSGGDDYLYGGPVKSMIIAYFGYFFMRVSIFVSSKCLKGGIIFNSTIPHPTTDDAPLFARPSRRGFYAPVAGRLSPIRINTFRNVGRLDNLIYYASYNKCMLLFFRVIGLCLSQGELFPMRLSRHVLKYILDRPISWLDLAFFDPQVLFESLRQLLVGDGDQAFFDAMQLRFVVDIPTEDPSQPSATVELKPNGENIPVTRTNVVEYVYRYVETRLLGDNIKCLQALRQGVFDVLPEGSLRGLTAEDLRLILCGTEQVCMATLQSLTTFADESHASTETLSRFKQWFWSVVDSLSMQEKQELVFFWTGAPSLPPLGEFWQPPPTVMVRPPDDAYLPTANTCISRLYVPLYSSRKVLRAKLQLAIKAKNFGFV